jgi:hypothetical protein
MMTATSISPGRATRQPAMTRQLLTSPRQSQRRSARRQHGGTQVGGFPIVKQAHPCGQSALPLKQSIVAGSGAARQQMWSTVPSNPLEQEQQS